MALIVVLSVFNGFEDLVKSLYSTFDPDLLIELKEGKAFATSEMDVEKIKQLPGVVSYTEVVEDNALLKFRSEQYIVTIKGVSDDFLYDNPLDTMLYDGTFTLKEGNANMAIMGYLVAYHLGVRINDFEHPVYIYVPKRTGKTLGRLDNAFNIKPVYLSAVFAVQQEFDSKYVIISLDLARELLQYKNEVTDIEIRLDPSADMEQIQEKVKEIAGNRFIVKNRFQQQELLYRIMKSEKWAIFLILSFILLIATFNLIGSLSMLILDKKKDIAILYSMGANEKTIKRIFRVEGMMISVFGALTGLILGALLCWVQMEFGLIRLGSEANAFIVPYYPVKMEIMDFISVFGIVLAIGFFTSWYPVRQITKQFLNQRIADFAKNQ
jgi:lipoprotein-releasing system permease protein